MNAQLAPTYPGAHTPSTSAMTRTMWGIAIVWFGVAVALAATGRLAEYSRFIGPFAMIPPILFVLAFAVSPSVRAWAFAFEIRTLVTAQALRVGGVAFIAVYAADSTARSPSGPAGSTAWSASRLSSRATT